MLQVWMHFLLSSFIIMWIREGLIWDVYSNYFLGPDSQSFIWPLPLKALPLVLQSQPLFLLLVARITYSLMLSCTLRRRKWVTKFLQGPFYPNICYYYFIQPWKIVGISSIYSTYFNPYAQNKFIHKNILQFFHSFLFRSCWTNCVFIFFFPVMGIQISIMSVKSQFLFYAKKFSLFCLFSIFSAEMQDSESIVKKSLFIKLLQPKSFLTSSCELLLGPCQQSIIQIIQIKYVTFSITTHFFAACFFSFSVFSHSLIEWMKTLFESGDLFLDC